MPRTPRKWTVEEDDELRVAVMSQLADGEVKDWCKIAAKLPGRTNKDCRKRWHNAVAGGLRKGQWSRSEDALLKGAVERVGHRWTIVADMVGTRSADQCAKRWQQSLNPELDRSQWSTEENRLLLEAVKAVGRHWTIIQKMHFPSRSKNGIKNRYTVLTRKGRNRASSSLGSPSPSETKTESAFTSNDESSDIDSDMGNTPKSWNVDFQQETQNFIPMEWNVQSPLAQHTASSEYGTPRTPDYDFSLMGTPDPRVWYNSSLAGGPSVGEWPSWMWDAHLLETIDMADPTMSENFQTIDTTSLDGSFGAAQSVTSFPVGPKYPHDGQLTASRVENLAKNSFISQPQAAYQCGMALPSAPPSVPGGFEEDGPVRVTLTLNNPNIETMNSLRRIAIANEADFRLERD